MPAVAEGSGREGRLPAHKTWGMTLALLGPLGGDIHRPVSRVAAQPSRWGAGVGGSPLPTPSQRRWGRQLEAPIPAASAPPREVSHYLA